MDPRVIPQHKVVIVCASNISESEISIMFFVCYCMFTLLHSSMNQELFKSTSEIKVATMKNMMVPRTPETEVSIALHCQLCSTHYTAV